MSPYFLNMWVPGHPSSAGTSANTSWILENSGIEGMFEVFCHDFLISGTNLTKVGRLGMLGRWVVGCKFGEYIYIVTNARWNIWMTKSTNFGYICTNTSKVMTQTPQTCPLIQSYSQLYMCKNEALVTEPQVTEPQVWHFDSHKT